MEKSKEPIITQKTYTGYNLDQKIDTPAKMPEWIDKFTESKIQSAPKVTIQEINRVWP